MPSGWVDEAILEFRRYLGFRVLETEVLPAYADRARWIAIMRASVAMSQWRFSTDRMVEDYVAKVYTSGR